MVIENHQWQNAPVQEIKNWLSGYSIPTCEVDKIGKKYNKKEIVFFKLY